MSVRLMSRVWELPYLNAGERLLLLAIADHCNDEGICYPSAERLQKKCGWSSRTYSKYIRVLQRAGIISKTPRADTRTGRKTDLIKINPSILYTGKEFDKLKAARASVKRKNPISLVRYKDDKKQIDKPPSLYSCKDKPLDLYQEEECSPENTRLDLETECLSIAKDLDEKSGGGRCN